MKETIIVIGPPGTGKSNLLGSTAEVYKANEIRLLCPLPREATSHMYKKHKVKAEIFVDDDWMPDLESYEYGAFRKLLQRLRELRSDDKAKVVLLDSGTDAQALASHELLAPFKAAGPKDTPDSRGYYGELKFKTQTLIKALTGLANHGKIVVCAWHAQSMKESDASEKGIAFEGGVMPALDGSYREILAGQFNTVVYSKLLPPQFDAKTKKMGDYRYVLQVKPDKERHAKVAGARVDREYIDNDFRALMELIG